jgi:flagellar biosynthetic protein FlhB
MAATHERKEKATGKRREDARKKGQVARSREVVQVGVLAVTVYALSRFGGHAISLLQTEMAATMAGSADNASRPIAVGDLSQLIARSGLLVAMTVGPIAVSAAVAAVAASVVQTGWLVTTEPLQFDWTRLSPVKGMQRIVTTGPYELLKMAVIVTSLTLVVVSATQTSIHDAARLSRLRSGAGAMETWAAIEQLLRRSLLVLAVVAAGDFGYQRYRHFASLRMSKQEVKEEERERDGNPQVKGRIRRIQREMARRRMLSATRRATVVVTNPTHYAVALEYRRESMPAPKVIAKGRGFLAQRIKEIAREAGVPIVEQVALAQALYKTAEVGETIPADLFEAVAEMLAYLIRLKQLVLR